MQPDDASAEAAAPIPKPPRLNPKLLIVGGAAALGLLLLVGGGALIFWPADAPAAKAAHAKAVHKVAAAASAPLLVAAALPAASAAQPAAATPPRTQDDGDVSPAQAVSHTAPEARVPTPKPRSADAEASMDRLQRRLGQVLGARAEVDVQHTGEWRLVTRANAVAPVAYAAPTRPVPADGAAKRHEPVAHWSYEGRGGPQAWGKLKPDFATCAKGQRQSPIDIRDGLALDLEPVLFDYRPSAFGVLDNGHTVQVNLAPGNSIEVNGRRFELLQFHFHRPSEERINGRQFDMDAHLVHRDAEGRLALVAVLLERGAAQPLLQTVWNNLPLEKNEEQRARGLIDLNALLPIDRRYYTYMGSLTTPPCSEGVLWVVMQQPVQVSGAQIDIFSRLYPMNARPIQQASGRLIKQSN